MTGEGQVKGRGIWMGIRTGQEFVESLRDGRTVFVAGERIKDVTYHPPFRGVVATLASLYDLQHERRDELSFKSPSSGERVAASFFMATTIEQVQWRIAAEQMPGLHLWPDGPDAGLLQRTGNRRRNRSRRPGST